MNNSISWFRTLEKKDYQLNLKYEIKINRKQIKGIPHI